MVDREKELWLKFRRRAAGWFLFLSVPLFFFQYTSLPRTLFFILIGLALLFINRAIQQGLQRGGSQRGWIASAVVADVLAITGAVYLTSGLQSPFIFLYFIELIVVHFYAGRSAGVATTLLSYLALVAVGVCEYLGFLPHQPFFADGTDPELYLDAQYLLGASVGLAFFFLFALYVSDFVLSWSRRKEEELRQSNDQIQRANQELEKSNSHLTELTQAIRRQNEQLLQANKSLEILNQMGRTLAEIQDFDSLLQTLVREMNRHFRFSDMAIFTFSEPGGKAALTYSTSPFSEASMERIRPMIQRVAYRKVMEVELVHVSPKGRALPSPNGETLPLSLNGTSIRRQRIILPILSRNRCIAVLIAERDAGEGVLGEDSLNLLVSVSHQLGISLANAELYRGMETLSITDGLTSLYNHRYFHQRLEEELRRTTRYKGLLALILSDLDFFKRVNDTYGHQIGDRVLAEMGEVLRIVSRDIDIPVRYGGEEFAIILPQTDLAGAMHVAERLRRVVEQRAFQGNEELRLTISVGLAHFTSAMGINMNELIRRADAALYYAKQVGRNRVHPYVIEPPGTYVGQPQVPSIESEEYVTEAAE
jgi:diguanylate cyclase (GGDEF)-like protein